MDTILEAKGVCKFFGGLKAVNNVDLTVNKGEILGIIGPNGAGKTTFFNLITSIFPLTQGEILFKGKNITKLSPNQIAELGIARTFQQIQLFKFMTVQENVMAGFHISTSTTLADAILHSKTFKADEKMIREESDKILERVGLMPYRDLMAGNLSYGIQRKVEIARALAIKPDVLLLDEPVAGMNPQETASLLTFIRKLNEDGLTVIVIEHDMKFVMNLCHRLVVLNFGEKICEGTPDVVKNDQAVNEAYFGKGLLLGEN